VLISPVASPIPCGGGGGIQGAGEWQIDSLLKEGMSARQEGQQQTAKRHISELASKKNLLINYVDLNNITEVVRTNHIPM
jgi:hypothetical protein